MHRCKEGDAPIKDKVLLADEDGWTQHCFKKPNRDLGEKMIFVESNVDWNEWQDQDEECGETLKQQFEEVKDEIEEQLLH